MTKPAVVEVILKPTSAARYDSIESVRPLTHGRVILMRDLFQCGKPLPIEDLHNEVRIKDDTETIPITQGSPSLFPSDANDADQIQRRPQKQEKMCDASSSEVNDEDTQSVRSLAASLVNQLNSFPRIKTMDYCSKGRTHCSNTPPIPPRPSKLPLFAKFVPSATGFENPQIHAQIPAVKESATEVSINTIGLQASQDELPFMSGNNSNSTVKDPHMSEPEKNVCDVPSDDASENDDELNEDESGEDLSDWDPLDEVAGSRLRDKFTLPSHLRPIAVNNAGLHLLEDGHFFYHAKGLPALPRGKTDDSSTTDENKKGIKSEECFEGEENGDRERDQTKSRRSVSFSTEPITVFSTHSVAAYRRTNDAINPQAASAEYELEKRLDELDLIDVKLNKGSNGLGINILGMGMTFSDGVEKLGIFVKAVTPGGAADIDGGIRVYDQLVEVDGQSLVGVSQNYAATVLQNTSGTVHFVVGRERPGCADSIATLLEADGQMTSSTCSSVSSNSEGCEDGRDYTLEHHLNSSSAEALRRLLADASATAAKAQLSDAYDDDEYNGLSDGQCATPTTSPDSADDTTEEDEGDGTLRASEVPGTDVSSASFDAGLYSTSEYDSGGRCPTRNSRLIGNLVIEALNQVTGDKNLESAEKEVCLGLSEEEKMKLRQEIQRSPFPVIKSLLMDLLVAKTQAKRLQSKVRRLGQRLTDQEAAADEAIERLCLRCHHLETRLAEKQQASAMGMTLTQTTATSTSRFPEGDSRGRLSPLMEQGEDTEEVEPDVEQRRLAEIRSKLSSVSALYADALEREEYLRRELDSMREEGKPRITTAVKCQTDQTPETDEDSTAEEGGVFSLPCNDRRTVDSCAPSEVPYWHRASTLPPPVPPPIDPSQRARRRRCSLDGEIPPPRPPKPPSSSASPALAKVNFTTPSKLNMAALPDTERPLLNPSNPFVVSESDRFFDFHMQRVKVGTSGAFSRKRPPSRPSMHNINANLHHLLPSSSNENPAQSPLPATDDDDDDGDHSASSPGVFLGNLTEPPMPSLITPEPSPYFRIRLPGLQNAIMNLKPVAGPQFANSNGPPSGITPASPPLSPSTLPATFCPTGSHPLVDALHDGHSVSTPQNCRRSMSLPKRPSPVERGVCSPDWTETHPPEHHQSLHHHYPRHPPAPSPLTSPTHSSGSRSSPAHDLSASPLTTPRPPPIHFLYGYNLNDPFPF